MLKAHWARLALTLILGSLAAPASAQLGPWTDSIDVQPSEPASQPVSQPLSQQQPAEHDRGGRGAGSDWL